MQSPWRMKVMAFAIGLACWIVAAPAHAQPAITIIEIPTRCAQFVPDSTRQLPIWDSALSFAACVQDASVPSIADPDEAAPVVSALANKLAPTVSFYLLALRRGPPTLALRDVYLIGLAHVALLTRARSAVPVPPDLHENEAAARAFAATHAAVEHELAPFAQTAWLVFATIDDAATENPDLGRDEVGRAILRQARELRHELEGHAAPWRMPRELKRLAGPR